MGKMPMPREADFFNGLLEPGPWLKEAIQKARAIWPHAAAYPGCGFTLFVDDAAGFLAALVDLHG